MNNLVDELAAAAHGARLLAVLKEMISDHGGSLPFFTYMDTVLHAPGLGYYAAGCRNFGIEGDFTTAPELGQLFGRTLARQCIQLFEQLGGSGDLLEIGAGSGALAETLLTELDRLNALPDHYLILELSSDLRQRQQQRLATLPTELSERVVWLDRLPEKLVGMVVANELLDALAVTRFEIDANGIGEWQVGWNDGLSWIHQPASKETLKAVATIEESIGYRLPPGYCSEFAPGLGDWIASVADCIERGMILLIDYGYPRHHYYHPQRSDGTLICHYRHQLNSDPLFMPGLQDITASVDFTAVAEAFEAAGLAVSGYTTQADFLLQCGLLELASRLSDGASTQQMARLSHEIRLLTMPGEMGERFQVIAATRNCRGEADWLGFGRFDRRHQLLPPSLT
jgi:SAM-dependent MidA family methyltransferase